MPEFQLRRLLEANRLAVEHLDLTAALRQIVEAAVELVGAQYGALGVLGSRGTLEQFIHVGMLVPVVEAIGAPPVGRGLLGALIADPQSVRLSTMDQDPRSVGFPANHPDMNSFLGVPLKVRGEVYGHLYLADSHHDAFSQDDQQLVEALAATAGVAISHARIFEESKRREQWTAATTKITNELLTNDDVDALQLIAESVLDLSGASLVSVILAPGSDGPKSELIVHRAAGLSRDVVVGRPLESGGTLVAGCLDTGLPQLQDGAGDDIDVWLDDEAFPGPAMAVPLPAGPGVRGSLFVLRDVGAPVFTEFDLDVVASFAGQAGIALDRADSREVRARAASLEDRDRIARDLHDHVVQRLFAAGLNIQSVCGALGPGAAADRLSDQVDEIDATIRQIRSTIFGLHANRGQAVGVRAMILEVITAATATLPGPPEVTFRGPIDLLVTAGLRDELVAVVREALTNAGRHAAAERVEIFVSADAHNVEVEVLDDGKGLAEGTVLSGLANLRARAVGLGGTFEIAARPGPGTRLHWMVPLPPVGS